MIQLGHVSEYRQSQIIRKLACLGLLCFDDPSIIPFLERFLKEPYIPRRKGGLDVFVTHITFGMTAMLEHLQEQGNEKQFEKARQKIMKRLEQLRTSD